MRQFEAKPAVREEVPLLIGLMGPPGGGKTFSALRLASGMAKVRGGDVVLIDTEHRARKYADVFRYKIVDFDPPFKPSDFLEAIRQVAATNPAAIIVDSMSDEHEGQGGVLDWHDREMGTDDRMSQRAWIKPKRDRIILVNGLNRIMVPLLMCFRSREKTAQVKGADGKVVPTNIGYMPIAPAELVHAMDLTCVLPPRANGVPVWHSDKAGEDFIIKLPSYLKPFIVEGKQLDEAMGEAFARWAKGDPRGGPKPSLAPTTKASAGQANAVHGPNNEFDSRDGGQIAGPAADRAPASSTPGARVAAHVDQGSEVGVSTREFTELDSRLHQAALKGTAELEQAWKELDKSERQILKAALDRRHKRTALAADQAAK